MSFFSDLFSGNFSNLGNDLAPSNIFSDTTKDIGGANTVPELLGGLALAAPFALPAIGGALGLGGAAATAATGAPLDILAGSAADTSLGAADTAALGFTGDVATDTSGLPNLITAGTSPSALTPASLVSQDFATLGPGATTAAAGAPLNLANAVTAGAADAGSGTAAAGGTPGILSDITSALSPITSTLKSVSPLIGAAGLGYNLYSGYEQTQAIKGAEAAATATAQQQQQATAAAQQAAAPEINQGEALQQYLTTGTLPQAYQAQVQQFVASAKAQIIQGYGARGQNTNPAQNSALAQDLANVDTQAQTLQASLEQGLATAGTQMVQTANSLLASGASATQISTQLPIQIAQLNAQLAAATGKSISSFAAAMNSSGNVNPSQVTLNLQQAA